ncbi:MAG: helix-turn-helix transcriptional regulator [Propionivibrio sp.]|nr:helix-turn-helix transcriptional regulator [Propionivibrio sp.]
MTDKNENADRDDVLFAFHQECSRPTANDISTWVRRYPQFAEDIRIHASIARDMADEEENPLEVPEAVFQRGYSRALSALYSADHENAASESDTFSSFEAVLEARGKTIPALANEIGIPRSVIADLFGGRASPPLSKRMMEALQHSLAISAEKVFHLLQTALVQPKLGMAKATNISAVVARPFEEVIRTSGMSEEKIRYWLEDD